MDQAFTRLGSLAGTHDVKDLVPLLVEQIRGLLFDVAGALAGLEMGQAGEDGRVINFVLEEVGSDEDH